MTVALLPSPLYRARSGTVFCPIFSFSGAIEGVSPGTFRCPSHGTIPRTKQLLAGGKLCMEVRGGLSFEHHWKESKCQDTCHLSYLLHGHPPWSYVHWEGRGPGLARAVPLASGRRREALSRVGWVPSSLHAAAAGSHTSPQSSSFLPVFEPSLLYSGGAGGVIFKQQQQQQQ